MIRSHPTENNYVKVDVLGNQVGMKKTDSAKHANLYKLVGNYEQY